MDDIKTFGIIESGSNSNGNYIKFSDGTMICTKRLGVDVAVNTAWGNLYDSATLSLGDYAKPFIDYPTITATVLSAAGGWIERIVNYSFTSFGDTNIIRPLSETRTISFSINLTAIGKWK